MSPALHTNPRRCGRRLSPRRLLLAGALLAGLLTLPWMRAGSAPEPVIRGELDDLYAIFKDEMRAGLAGGHFRNLGHRWQLDGIVYNHVFRALNACDMLRTAESTAFSGKEEVLRRQADAAAEAFQRVLDSLPWPRFAVDLEPGGIAFSGPPALTAAQGIRQPLLFSLRNRTGATRTLTLSSARIAFERDRADVAPGQTRHLLGVLESPEPGEARTALAIAAGAGLARRETVRLAVEPTGWLAVRLREGSAPARARVRVTDARGRYWPPEQLGDGLILKMHGPEHDQIAERWFYADGSFRVRAPAGRVRIAVRRGLEYAAIDEEIAVEAGRSVPRELALTRLSNMRAQGWYSGDVHIHYLDPATALFEAKAEDLHVASVLVFDQLGMVTAREHFTGALDPVSDREHLVYYDEEFRNDALGHISLLGLKRLVEPISTGYLGTTHRSLFRGDVFNDFEPPPVSRSADSRSPDRLLIEATRATHRQGAIVNWAHLRDELEFPLDAALGELDAVDILTNTRLDNAIPSWYHLLNCGLRLPATAGTDRGGPALPIGHQRTYVRLDEPFTYRSWIEGIRRGRSFVTNGPMLTLTVGGLDPGGEIRLGAPGEVEVRAEAVSRLPFRRLELVVNGDVVRAEEAAAGGRRARLSLRLPVRESAWIAARVAGDRHPEIIYYPHPQWSKPVFAHTNPVYVRCGDTPLARPASARALLERMARLEAWVRDRADFGSEERRREALRLVDAGAAFYRKIAGGPPGSAASGSLPRVLLVGDSIRMGYAPFVAERLAGNAQVVSAAANGGNTANLLANFEEWIVRERPDVVHFNAGLHDLKVGKETGRYRIDPDQYRANLRRFLARLPEAGNPAVVFASITPVVDSLAADRPGGDNTLLREADVRRYNAVALEVMRAARVPIDDLHAVVEGAGVASLQVPDGIHYTPAGYQRLAEAVADSVLRALAARPGTGR